MFYNKIAQVNLASYLSIALKFIQSCFILLLLHGCAQTSHDHAVNPAYRPSSENSAAFVKDLKSATVAVYPSIIRTRNETSYSQISQQQVVSLLNEKKVTTAFAETEAINAEVRKGESQWEMFLNDLHRISASLKSKRPDAQYILVMEILLQPDNLAVFGIHCYLFDQQGNNAFSFLLNSHHQLFIDARLSASDSSQASRARLIEKATRVGVTALIQQVNAPQQKDALKQQGYSITSQKVATFDGQVARIFIITRLHERLIPVFMHSFKHSLVSGLETNGVEAVFKYMSRDSNDLARFNSEVAKFSPDALMHIDLDPLYRQRKDGYQAIVGTDFEVSVTNMASAEILWQATGRVDYIQDYFFKRGSYRAHEGIRKEFAWHTTAAIVRTFIRDVNGHKSAPIYTATEDRELYRQRTD